MLEKIPYPLRSIPFSRSPLQVLRDSSKFRAWKGNYMQMGCGWIGDGSLIFRDPSSLQLSSSAQRLLALLSAPVKSQKRFDQKAVYSLARSFLSPLPPASLPPVEVIQEFRQAIYAHPNIRVSGHLAVSGAYHNFLCSFFKPSAVCLSFTIDQQQAVIFYFQRGLLVAVLAALKLPFGLPPWEEGEEKEGGSLCSPRFI